MIAARLVVATSSFGPKCSKQSRRQIDRSKIGKQASLFELF
jgi:hypothetical protein